MSVAPVLVIGEALIDVVQREGVAPVEHVGGSPANVALGLGRLGVPVRLRTALAPDERGARIAAHLADSGVQLDPESYVLGHTAVAVARITAEGNAQYDFDVEWRICSPIELGAAQVVHVGSIGCLLEPGATSVREALRSFSPHARLTFDPNIRPALVGEWSSAVAATEEIVGESTVVKLSDEDAAWLYPDSTVDGVVDRLLTLGATVVAVTLGSEGSLIASDKARVRIAPSRVSVADTVGAGDTYMAALVASVAEGQLSDERASLAAAGNRAALAAAITIGRAGADLPTWAELSAAASQDTAELRGNSGSRLRPRFDQGRA